MPFTRRELAEHLETPDLINWYDNMPPDLEDRKGEIAAYMNTLLQWITQNGGDPMFGQIEPGGINLVGLVGGIGNMLPAVFTDVFHDIPVFLPTDNFSSRQAVENIQRLIKMLLR